MHGSSNPGDLTACSMIATCTWPVAPLVCAYVQVDVMRGCGDDVAGSSVAAGRSVEADAHDVNPSQQWPGCGQSVSC